MRVLAALLALLSMGCPVGFRLGSPEPPRRTKSTGEASLAVVDAINAQRAAQEAQKAPQTKPQPPAEEKKP